MAIAQISMTTRDAPDQCPGCLGPISGRSQRQTHRSGYNSQMYTLHRCNSCDLEFWSPLKADPSFYENAGFAAYDDYHSGSRPFPRWALPLFRNLPITSGRALDIGCGDGSVLQKLKHAGLEPHGIDLDRKSIDAARSRYGLTTVTAMSLDELVRECRMKNSKFELVTFFEVLEHQDDPRRFLNQITEILPANGVIAGSVPNRNRFLSRLDRRVGAGDFPPHHFLWFSKNALLCLLQRTGFSDIRIVRTGALPFLEILRKLTRLFRKKSLTFPGQIRWLLNLALVLTAPAMSVILWAGMRLRPSHLYFQCTYVRQPAP